MIHYNITYSSRRTQFITSTIKTDSPYCGFMTFQSVETRPENYVKMVLEKQSKV